MEDSSPGQNEPEQQQFYCHLCGVYCASALNLQTHFLGFRHKKAEEALRNHGDSFLKGYKQPTISKPVETLEDQINACKSHEPAVGLEYIHEFHTNGYITYACKLCNCQLQFMHMFMHIVGAKHRINYLSKHHPALGFLTVPPVTSSKKIRRLRKACIEVEKKFGRQKIKVLNEPYVPWTFESKCTPSSGINYGPNSKQDNMDFTNEDFTAPVCTSTAEKPVTFQDLKAANEARKAAGFCIETVSQEVIEDWGEDDVKNEENEDSCQDKSCDSKEDACNKEVSCDSEDFTDHKELIDFLESFKICGDSEVTFLLNVSKKLTDALLQYKKCRIEEDEKKKKESELAASKEQEKCPIQSAMSSVQQPSVNEDSATNDNKIQTFQPFKITYKAPKPPLIRDIHQEHSPPPGPKSKLEKMCFTDEDSTKEDFIDPTYTSTAREHNVTFLDKHRQNMDIAMPTVMVSHPIANQDSETNGNKIRTFQPFRKTYKAPNTPLTQDRRQERPASSGINYVPKSNLEKRRFTDENCTNQDLIDPTYPSTAREHNVTFLDKQNMDTSMLNVKIKHPSMNQEHLPPSGINDEPKSKPEKTDFTNDDFTVDDFSNADFTDVDFITSYASTSSEHNVTAQGGFSQNMDTSVLNAKVRQGRSNQGSSTNGNKTQRFQRFKTTSKAHNSTSKRDRPQESAMKTKKRFPYGKRQDSAISHHKNQKAAPSRFQNKNNTDRYQKQHRSKFNAVGNNRQEFKDRRFQEPRLNRGSSTTQRFPLPHGRSTGISSELREVNQITSPAGVNQITSPTGVNQINSPTPPKVLYPHGMINNVSPAYSKSNLPVAKDNVTAQFFESIKTMDVSEVASTLNKITATNPAFKGINVPSLVQYLMKTGMLKSSSSTQESKQ